MVSSKPSRRICSISTPSCSSPRPATSKASVSLESVILMATLPSASRNSRSRIWREVTFLPSRPASGRVVDAERHRQGRRIDRDGFQRAGQFRRADGVGDGAFGQAGHGDDVAGHDLVHRHAIQAAEGQQLGQPAGFDHRAVAAQHLHRHVDPAHALLDAAGQHAAQEVVVFQDAGDHGERQVRLHRRRRHVAQHQVEQRRQILARAVQVSSAQPLRPEA